MVRYVPLFIALLVASGAALAQNHHVRPHSAKDDDACRGDAHRLCRDVFPAEKDLPADQFKMLACLQQHRAKLSRACAAILQKNGV